MKVFIYLSFYQSDHCAPPSTQTHNTSLNYMLARFLNCDIATTLTVVQGDWIGFSQCCQLSSGVSAQVTDI